jgi:CubicO group peptidase (beta-lactamase class C family)
MSVQSLIVYLVTSVLLPAVVSGGVKGVESAVIDLAPDLAMVRQKYNFPALASAVILDGKLHAAGVVGVRKHGGDIKVEPNDPFHLGSCTKAMTASLIGLLVQQGKLTWGTTLAEYFPGLKDRMHPDYRDVTLVHLLSHRAGVAPMTNGFSPVGDEELRQILAINSPSAQRRRVMEIVLCQPPIHKPGDKYEYSNAGFTIAGVIAETLTGEDYESLLRRLLFEPLGMASAGFGAMGTSGRVDAPWQHRKQGDQLIPIHPGPRSDNPPFITPAGRVHCSITDWTKYIQCLLRAIRQEQGLLPPDQVRQLKDPPFGGEYALGWVLCDRPWGGGKVLTHAGSNNMNYCVAWVAPAKNFAVLVATNRGGDGASEGLDEICTAMIKRFLAYK